MDQDKISDADTDSVKRDNNLKFKLQKKGRTCGYFFQLIDLEILKPIFVYKYNEIRRQPFITFGDMLAEYKQIEDELLSDEDDLGGDF